MFLLKETSVEFLLCTFTSMCLKSLVTDLGHQHLHRWQPSRGSKPPSDVPDILSWKALTDGTFEYIHAYVNITYGSPSGSLQYAYCTCWYGDKLPRPARFGITNYQATTWNVVGTGFFLLQPPFEGSFGVESLVERMLKQTWYSPRLCTSVALFQKCCKEWEMDR